VILCFEYMRLYLVDLTESSMKSMQLLKALAVFKRRLQISLRVLRPHVNGTTPILVVIQFHSVGRSNSFTRTSTVVYDLTQL